MALQDTIEQTVTGLGYALVDVERTVGGLLRITIDLPWQAGTPELFINAEDCEKVTRQLQFVLEVEGAAYARLEVSSPGIDRPLRTEEDFARFVGQLIDIALKAPIGSVAATATTGIAATRKKFRGTLEKAESGADGQWQIVWSDPVEAKPGQKISKNRPLPPLHALGFRLDELQQARLAPVVDFKGRSSKALASNSADGELSKSGFIDKAASKISND